ncbi:hypothetical protein [Coleofasciculus chthonoplastes]|uniref:hypothetical protein n=1 Tax=Coleofasciculus chthonoplastes TaxID=64178 RepID=UPI00330141F0
MTSKVSLETYYSTDIDTELATVQWQVSDRKDMWHRLFEILTALAERQESVRSMTGRFTVDISERQESDEDLRQEIWSVVVDSLGIQQLKEKYGSLCESMGYVMPDTMTLRCETDLLLPPQVDSVRIIAFDYVDSENWELLELKPTAQHDTSTGYKVWQTVAKKEDFEEQSTIYMEIACELSPYAQDISLTLHSRLDIWRPVRFDGTPNEPQGTINFQQLKRSLAHLAEQTGGVLNTSQIITSAEE